jgi:hypothetical protein
LLRVVMKKTTLPRDVLLRMVLIPISKRGKLAAAISLSPQSKLLASIGYNVLHVINLANDDEETLLLKTRATRDFPGRSPLDHCAFVPVAVRSQVC